MAPTTATTNAIADKTNKKREAASDEDAGGAKKKAGVDTAEVAAAATTADNTPYRKYFDRMDAFVEANGLLGNLMIRGIPRDESSDNEDSEEDVDEEKEVVADKSKYTDEQMNALRFVLINKDRDAALDEMRRFVLGDQADEGGFLMFNTSFSYQIHDGFYEFKPKYAKLKEWDKKFNKLFAYTYNLIEYDVWMHDNEGGMDKMVKELAGLWKKLLAQTDKELGIDSSYSRPGVVALLEDFKEEIESHYSEPKFKFNYM